MAAKYANPDRIDFERMSDGRTIVQKIWRLQNRRAAPLKNEIKKADFDLAAALDWLREHGYVVHDWGYGMRAWKAEEPWAIRRTDRILAYREKLVMQEMHYYRQLGQNGSNTETRWMWKRAQRLLTLDLAYDG